MIVKGLMELTFGIIRILFSILPNLPSLPTSLQTSIDTVFGIIFDNLNILGIFVRISTLKTLIPLIIAVLAFEKIYHFVMWILKKIPLSIE